MSSVCLNPEVTLPSDSCEEPRYRSKHSFSETRRRHKHKSKDRKKSSKKHNLQTENTPREYFIKVSENTKNIMTIAEKKAIERDFSGRFNYDGFGNLITDDCKDTENENNYGGDCVKLDDISKDIDNDKVGNLAWLYGTEHLSDAQDTFYPSDPGLSQSESDGQDEPVASYRDFYPDEERLEIEAEIKRKFAELEELMDKIQAVKNRKRRRRHSKRRKGSGSSNVNDADLVNIIPIKRERRLAQPIRNALLIRTAMKKAWRGALGSCCGMGCWAHWKWTNLRHVMSDYE